MDVTNENFRIAIYLLERLLPGASFVSVDFEFSGIGFSRPSNLDTPEIRYQTARHDAREYPPLQFGVSIFHLLTSSENGHENNQRPHQNGIESLSELAPHSSTNWHSTTFNFNLHPRAVYFPFNQNYPLIDREFRVQASSIHFLATHGFDFKKNFNSGITWLRKSEEVFLRKTVTEMFTSRRNPRHPVSKDDISEEDAAYVKRFRETLDDWISKNDHPAAQTSNPPAKIGFFEYPRHPFHRRLIFDLIRQHYPRIAILVINNYGVFQLRVALHASVQLAECHRARDLQMEIEQVVSKEVAARYVFDIIQLSKVPVVVHNGLLDLTKWVANFVQDLPPTLVEFKERIKELFPRLFDTKWAIEQLRKCDRDVATLLPQESSFTRYDLSQYVEALRKLAQDKSLENVYDFRTFIPLDKMSEKELDEKAPISHRLEHLILSEYDDNFDDSTDYLKFSKYANDEQGRFKHEAGFDALETGILFVLIRELADVKKMEAWSNKMFLGSCGGYKYIDFGVKDDPNEWFEKNVVIISGEWNREGREHRCIQVLRHILKDTAFDTDKSDFSIVHKSQFIGLLNYKENIENTFSAEEIEKVVAQGAKLGLNVVRYQLETLTDNGVPEDGQNGTNDHKRRKLE